MSVTSFFFFFFFCFFPLFLLFFAFCLEFIKRRLQAERREYTYTQAQTEFVYGKKRLDCFSLQQQINDLLIFHIQKRKAKAHWVRSKTCEFFFSSDLYQLQQHKRHPVNLPYLSIFFSHSLIRIYLVEFSVCYIVLIDFRRNCTIHHHFYTDFSFQIQKKTLIHLFDKIVLSGFCVFFLFLFFLNGRFLECNTFYLSTYLLFSFILLAERNEMFVEKLF